MDAAQVSVPATPPVALAPGQSVAWALPTEATANSQYPSSNGSSGANVDGTGTVIMTSSCGLCNWFWGAYWMGRTGSTSEPEDMRLWPRERLDHLYRVTREQQERGLFLPKKSNMCSGCSVRDYCFAVNGAQSDTVPTPWELVVEMPGSKT